MDIEQFKKIAADIANSAVQVGVDAYNKGKDEVDLFALKTKLSGAQRQLGALVYTLHKNGEKESPLITQYIANIAAIEADMEAVGAKMPSEQATTSTVSVTFCPACGAEVDPNIIFCPGCGTKL